jgi:hypothetical protein
VEEAKPEEEAKGEAEGRGDEDMELLALGHEKEL